MDSDPYGTIFIHDAISPSVSCVNQHTTLISITTILTTVEEKDCLDAVSIIAKRQIKEEYGRKWKEGAADEMWEVTTLSEGPD